jgi:hypothetical protein
VQAFSNLAVLSGGIAELGEDRRIALLREHLAQASFEFAVRELRMTLLLSIRE